MVFASPIFLFLFLPLTLAAYFVVPRAWRNGVLLVASLVFYAWGEAPYVVLVAGLGRLQLCDRRRDRPRARNPAARRRWLALGVTGNLDAARRVQVRELRGRPTSTRSRRSSRSRRWPSATIPLPLGISFFTFHAISYVVDVYKRNAHAERNLPRFALYILLFPQLIAGPIIRWRDIAAQLADARAAPRGLRYGVRRFVLGLGKKVLIANTLGRVADQIFALPASDLTTPLAWLGLVCYTLQIYFDFSGYSDMAIGLMRMFGFRILENFNYPYIARSIREFWRRWHISLSNWFRDYLYIPLGGNQRGERRAYANLVLVFLLCGLWHGASWPFVLWGAWHGAFLVAERAWLDRVLRACRPLAHVYALLAVMGGWVLFRCDTLPQAATTTPRCWGMRRAIRCAVRSPSSLDPLVLITLVVAIVFATPLARRIGQWRDRRRGPVRRHGPLSFSPPTSRGSVSCSSRPAAFLAAGTYNPFIYFRF